jgi:hypothetical protein
MAISPISAASANTANAPNTTRSSPFVARATESADPANAAQARMNAAPTAGLDACHGWINRTPNSTTQESCEMAMSRELKL